MRAVSVPQRVMAVSLAFILASCSTARYSAAGPTGSQDLARYALVIKTSPDEQVTHEWIPLKDLDTTEFQLAMSSVSTRQDITRVSTADPELRSYCEGRYDQCVPDCESSPKPVIIDWRRYTDSKAQPWRTARYWWCKDNCRAAELECKARRGQWYAEYSPSFRAIEPAIDWIKQHREELVVGAVVVVAGVAFAVVVTGSMGGALVLVPLLALAEATPGLPHETRLMEARR